MKRDGRWAAPAVLGFVVAAGCSNPGVESNFNRTSERTALLSTANIAEKSDLTGVTGEATYEGVATINLEAFPATADARLVADFDSQSISGALTNWTDAEPLTHTVRGSAVIFAGAIDMGEGDFTASIAGNVERRPHGALDPDAPPRIFVFDGSVTGAFHDSTDGEAHSHVVGGFSAGTVSGDFVARR